MTELNQADFEAALAEAANEWPDNWFNNWPDERRVTVDDLVGGRAVTSKGVHIPIAEMSHAYLAQGFRVLFHAFNTRVRGGHIPSPHSPTPPAAKAALCLRTPKDIWGDGIWHFSLRDNRTSLAFDIFTSPNRPFVVINSTWSVT